MPKWIVDIQCNRHFNNWNRIGVGCCAWYFLFRSMRRYRKSGKRTYQGDSFDSRPIMHAPLPYQSSANPQSTSRRRCKTAVYVIQKQNPTNRPSEVGWMSVNANDLLARIPAYDHHNHVHVQASLVHCVTSSSQSSLYYDSAKSTVWPQEDENTVEMPAMSSCARSHLWSLQTFHVDHVARQHQGELSWI